MLLELSTYLEIEKYLKENKGILLPIGSIEQHSPDGILGTDHLIAQAIARDIGKRKQIAVGPSIATGIAIHHTCFAGTISLQPSTLILYLKDYLSSLFQHGFEHFFFINGHGGNIATITAACAELSHSMRIKTEIVSWWHLAEVKQKEQELFGSDNGQHATVSEISITRYLFPEAFQDRNGSAKPIVKNDYETQMPEFAWPLSPDGFREIFPFGNMGSNPAMANAEHGKILYNLALDTICDLWDKFCAKKY